MICWFVASAITVGLVSLSAWMLLTNWLSEWSATPLYVAGLINLAASWISGVPLVMAMRSNRTFLPQAALAAMALRILLASLSLIIVMVMGYWPLFQIGIWMLAFYLPLLGVETYLTASLLHAGTMGTTKERRAMS